MIATDDVINAAERTAGVTITGTNEAGATVTVNGNAATVTGTTWSYSLSAAAINAFGQDSETITVVATDSAGNTTNTNRTITVDTVAPTADAVTATVAPSGVNANALVKSTEIGVAYLVKDTLTPTSVNGINSAPDGRWNAVNITTAGSDTTISTIGLEGGSYHVYSADAAGNLSLAATNSITVDASAPTITGTSITGVMNGHGGSDLVTGDHILVTLTMSEVVTVTGAPTYEINVGGVNQSAIYVSGSGTNTIVFSYAVTQSDYDVNGGITADVNALLVNVDAGIFITDIVGNLANVSSSAIAPDTNSIHVDATVPTISNASAFGLNGVSNLDVTSDIVLKFNTAVTAVLGGHISLINDTNNGTKLGYLGESTQNNIELYFGSSSESNGITTVQTYADQSRTILSGTISINNATGAVSINPLQDLDLSNNYHVFVGADAFTKTSSGLANAEIGADGSYSFKTVTPSMATPSGDITSIVGISSTWGADGAILADSGHDWVSIEGIGSPSSMVVIDANKSLRNHMFLVQNISTSPEETSFSQTTGISFRNFTQGRDKLYVDYQDNSLPLPTNTSGALGYVNTSGENAGAAYQVAPSSNNEGNLSALEFLNLTQAQANHAVIFG
jgi:hypothetical protein